MKALEIARVSMLRTLRDRMGLFFILVLPMILIVVLGLTYGGMNTARIGVADLDATPLARDLVSSLRTTEIRLDVRRYGSTGELQDAVERGFVELGLVIEPGYDAALRGGGTGNLRILGQPESVASVVRAPVDAAIADQVALVRAARFAAANRGISFETALEAAKGQQASVPGVGLALERVGDLAVTPSGFATGAESQVILFMFLTSMTGAATLVSTRQLGISRREFSTPTTARSIVLGEVLGRFAFALFQGSFIVLASALLFGVDWVDPLATGAIVVAFALVASGAAMLVASLASNESQVGAIGVALGMITGLLGGAMVPREVFPEVMQTISNITPHAWALDAFHRLSLYGGGLADVLPQVGVLLGFAVVVLGLASWRFRRIITAGGI